MTVTHRHLGIALIILAVGASAAPAATTWFTTALDGGTSGDPDGHGVAVVGIGDDGALLVGEAARNQHAAHPERTVRSIKRRMGEDARAGRRAQRRLQCLSYTDD